MGKLRTGWGISIRSDGDEQLTCAYIDSRGIRMQDRQCVTSSFALFGHLLLRSSRSDVRGADTEQTPNRIVVGNRQTSSHVCTQPQTHAFRSGFKSSTNVGAGCNCHPTGSTIIAQLVFLYILSGPGRPVARF